MSLPPVRTLVRSLGLAACLGAGLNACNSPTPAPLHLPEMTFTEPAPIRLNVARIEIDSQYKAPAAAPHIEYDMPVSPENAVRRWAQDRLRAVGQQGVLRVVIRNASATEVPLATDKGLTGMFTKQQAAKVDLALDVELQILDERQFVLASVSAQASRSRTEVEGRTLNQRDQLLYDTTYDLVRGFDHEISVNIPNGFNRWLVAG